MSRPNIMIAAIKLERKNVIHVIAKGFSRFSQQKMKGSKSEQDGQEGIDKGYRMRVVIDGKE